MLGLVRAEFSWARPSLFSLFGPRSNPGSMTSLRLVRARSPNIRLEVGLIANLDKLEARLGLDKFELVPPLSLTIQASK